MKATATITIERPIDDVFAFVTDVAQMPRWITGVTAARLASAEMGAGARYVLDYTGGWRSSEVEIEVAEFSPPHTFATRSSRGPFAFEGRMELQPVDEGTAVANIIEAGPDSLSTRIASWLFGRMLRPQFTKRLLRELEQLRTAIES
jgi:uncharacterized protein YndB with AHSA1/START domain